MKQEQMGRRIRRERKRKRILIPQMAQDLGWEETFLADIEGGKILLPEEDILRTAVYLDVDPFLFGIRIPLEGFLAPKHLWNLLHFEKPKGKKGLFKENWKEMRKFSRECRGSLMTELWENELFHPQKIALKRPFLFLRVLAVLGCIILLGAFSQDVVVTALSFGCLVPFVLLWALFESNPDRSEKVSGMRILSLFLFGGLLSIIFVFFLRDWIGYPQVPFVKDLVTGLVEETAKILIVAFLCARFRISKISTGILLGFAVGAGFAGIENARYGIDAFLLVDGAGFVGMEVNLFVRSYFQLIGASHPFWTGMLAGALFSISPTGHFECKNMGKPLFLEWFGVSVMLHALYNFFVGLPGGIICGTLLGLISLTLFLAMWKKAIRGPITSDLELSPEVKAEVSSLGPLLTPAPDFVPHSGSSIEDSPFPGDSEHPNEHQIGGSDSQSQSSETAESSEQPPQKDDDPRNHGA